MPTTIAIWLLLARRLNCVRYQDHHSFHQNQNTSRRKMQQNKKTSTNIKITANPSFGIALLDPNGLKAQITT
jgi:hypothetical protein